MKQLLIYIFLLTCPFLHGQDTLRRPWFKIGFNLALIGNTSYSNIYDREHTHPIPYGSIKSEKLESKPISFGFSAGAESILGKSKIIKHIIGVNYDYTNSNFNYKFESSVPHGPLHSSYYYENLNKKRNVQFLGLSYGLKFQYKHLNAGIFATYNFILSRVDIENGYMKETVLSDCTVIENRKIISKGDTNFISIRLRIAYDFYFIRQSFSVFVMRNFNVSNFLTPEFPFLAPYYYLGLQWFPRKSRKTKA